MELLNHFTRLTAMVVAFCLGTFAYSQSLIPTTFTFSSCGFALSPIGYVTCVGSPDCAASRCTVPSGCSGQAVMVFGESFSYVLSTPLVAGQTYQISMNVSTGHLGASSIISGNHTFQIVGTTFVPPTCGSSSYGSICGVSGGQVLLTGTVNTIGWVNFTNTFVAGSNISRLTFTNCDGTGNGGNLFCSPSLIVSVPLPAAEIEGFAGQYNDCAVELEWSTALSSSEISRFDIYRSVPGDGRRMIGTYTAGDISGKTQFRYTDFNPGTNGHYQLEMVDAEGRVAQSPVIEVLGECAVQGLEILSNPVVGDIATLRYNPQTTSGALRVYDIAGRMVYETVLAPGEEASATHTIDVVGWKPGLYLVRMGMGEVVKMYIGK